MKRFNAEKAIATFQRRCDKARARSHKLEVRYAAMTGKLYLDPRFWDHNPKEFGAEPSGEYDFVAWYGRENLFVKTAESGYGYREYRTISAREFERLDRLEVQLLDAWDKENELAWQLREARKAAPSLFEIDAA